MVLRVSIHREGNATLQITENTKKLDQKAEEPGETVKQTSGRVRPELVSRWQNCMLKVKVSHNRPRCPKGFRVG